MYTLKNVEYCIIAKCDLAKNYKCIYLIRLASVFYCVVQRSRCSYRVKNKELFSSKNKTKNKNKTSHFLYVFFTLNMSSVFELLYRAIILKIFKIKVAREGYFNILHHNCSNIM